MPDQLPLKHEDGSWIVNPGLMFWCATVETNVESLWESYLHFSKLQSSNIEKRYGSYIRKDSTNRGHVGHIVQEMRRSIVVEGKACSLGEAQSRVAHHHCEAISEAGQARGHSNYTMRNRDLDFLSKSIETIRKAWRIYKKISHFQAVAVLGNRDPMLSAASNQKSGEQCLGLAASYQDLFLDHFQHLELDLIRVPDEIPRVSLDALKFNQQYCDEKMPPRIVRYHK